MSATELLAIARLIIPKLDAVQKTSLDTPIRIAALRAETALREMELLIEIEIEKLCKCAKQPTNA